MLVEQPVHPAHAGTGGGKRGLGVKQMQVRALRQQPVPRAVVGVVVQEQKPVYPQAPIIFQQPRQAVPLVAHQQERPHLALRRRQRVPVEPGDRIGGAVQPRVVSGHQRSPAAGAPHGAVLPVEAGQPELHLAMLGQLAGQCGQHRPRHLRLLSGQGRVAKRQPYREAPRVRRQQGLGMFRRLFQLAVPEGKSGQLC